MKTGYSSSIILVMGEFFCMLAPKHQREMKELAIVAIYGCDDYYVEPYSEQKELFRGTYQECEDFIKNFNT